MTEEKKGVSAWLRGIIDECGVSGTQSCTAIAKAFGIDCWHEKTCRGCIAKMMTAIAYRIDLDMVGYERLKKENDELREMLERWQNYHLNMIARAAKKFAGLKDGGSK